MIRVIDVLPESIEVQGREYPVYTDFRAWMDFELMLMDGEIDDEEKPQLMLDWFEKEKPDSLESACNAILWFYRCGVDPDECAAQAERHKKPPLSYDFSKDSGMIFAAFMQAYGIDLESIEYMHWWKFHALLENLPDNTRFAQIMSLLNTDTKDMSQKQREHIKRIQSTYARRGRKTKRVTLQQRNDEMKTYVQRRFTQVGNLSILRPDPKNLQL